MLTGAVTQYMLANNRRRANLASAELFDPQKQFELFIVLQELRLNLFAGDVARQKVKSHPLDDVLGSNWKASSKRLAELLQAEERRVGLI